MRPVYFERRHNWQRHVQANSYQADVLSDPSKRYWVEALEKPFYLELFPEEEVQISEATEALGKMCVEFLDWFFTGTELVSVDERLKQLGIPEAYWKAIKLSWDRQDPEDLYLYLRFDFQMNDGCEPQLLELNADTPLLGAEQVYQWSWFEDMLRLDKLPPDATQFNDWWDLVAKRFRQIIEEYELEGKAMSFLVDPRLGEDLEMATQLIQIIQDDVDDQQYCQIVYVKRPEDDDGNLIQVGDDDGNLIRVGIGLDDAGMLVDHHNDVMPFVWKIYDWSDLQNDLARIPGATEKFAAQLERGDQKYLAPLWMQVLANKGAMPYMWEQYKDHPVYGKYLLETYFETDISTEATTLMLNAHVRKPFIGLEGVAVEIKLGGLELEKRNSFGYGEEGFIVQEYAPLPTAGYLHYMIGSWLIDDESGANAAGIVVRADPSPITGRHCVIVPHIIAGSGMLD